MKTIILLLIACCFLFTGCLNRNFTLPAVQGESVTYTRTDPLGGTQIDATNVKVTEKTVSADTATWNTTYPAFTFKLSVKGYKRVRTANDKPVEAETP